MEKGKLYSIPGTVISTQHGHLLVSSGIDSLDTVLGGGLPVGTVALIEEDFRGLYSKVLLKYFLAEGLTAKHSIFIASQDVNPANIVSELPAVIESDPEPENPSKGHEINDKMKIAFRYQNISSAMQSSHIKHIGHHFDLSRTMSFSDLENSDIYYWTGQRIETGTNSFLNPAYNDLLKSVKDKIKEGKFFLKDNPESKTILRIGIHSLGSPMWLPCRKSIHSMDSSSQDLNMFIFCLRALVRSANAVAVITVPSYLYGEESLERCIHSSDISMRLQSFTGTELENNQSLQDYHGFFYLTKLAAINSLASKHPGSVEYVFKLRRKKFVIDMLHLPPDIGDDKENKKKESVPMLGCGGSNKHLLEF
ncbi:elongator complex protein 4 [Sitophilus oryzae]|uniref:Elongator complex protein 4 n=1 Tax=Sitophilus oryzae TaxID=7048 RepID=A0A6J2YWL4_SITOR|nr:elongator complex protein 4 [Sitophilus oryzae]